MNIKEELEKKLNYGNQEFIFTTTKNHYLINIDYCIDIESPRNWDNIYIMACKHRNYNLGDIEIREDSLIEYMANVLIEDGYINYHSIYYFNTYGEIRENSRILKVFNKYYTWDNLSLYDHSGITISKGIRQGWDYGVIGIIYASKDKLKKEFQLKKVDKKRFIACIDNEIYVYNDYLQGNIMSYTIKELPNFPVLSGFPIEIKTKEDFEEIDLLDSCSGFYGLDNRKNGILDYILDNIK